MRQTNRGTIVAACFFLLTLTAETDAAQPKAQSSAAGLNPQEQKVIGYLLNDWGKDYSVTSVDLAMQALGIPASGEFRFRVGNYIKTHPEIHEVIRRWGWETLVLTPDEKLIARAVVNRERQKRPIPPLADVARSVGVPERDAKRGLMMLERHGILRQDKSAGGVGYVAASPRYLNWERRLDFHFHKVTLSSGRLFNTNWAVDFMLLVGNQLSTERVTIEDSSPDSTNRIRLVFDKGDLVKAEPESSVVFLGGGWAFTNLFSSEEALNLWLERYPELKDRPHATVSWTLQQIKNRRQE